MADRYPYRPGSHDSQNPSAPAESDPLAELARLIGQTDPFASFGRADPKASQSPPEPAAHDREPPSFPDGDAPAAEELDNPGRPAWLRHLPRQDEPVAHATTQAPHPSEWPPLADAPARYEDVLFGQGHSQGGLHPEQPFPQGGYPQAGYAQSGHAQGGYDQAGYSEGQYVPDQAGADRYDPQYDQYAPDAYPYRAPDDEPVAVEPRKGGMITVAVVFALALVGTATAFAYRAYRAPSSGEPPIIRADASPTKITPAASADASGKINDRVAGGSERIVPREEQPVDVKDPSKARVVFPPLNQGGAVNANASAAPPTVPPITVPGAAKGAVQAPSSAASAADEPRKVKILTIRGDGSTAPATPAVAPPPVAPVVPTATAKRAAAAPPPSPVQTPPPARQEARQEQPSRAPALATPPSGANGPMLLTPGSASSAEDRTRVASVQPQQQVSRGNDASGSFFVQVSSQRSEADAQNSYRALQSKFPGVLGSRAPMIRRADLGDKGVYYRALIGPFATSGEAGQFCGSLSSAGGQCVVQRN